MRKHLVFVAFLFLALISCEETKEQKQAMLPASSGNINNLQVIIDDILWEGEVGEAIRKNFAATVDGLPQEEPLFSINQLPPNSFDGFTQKNRLFIYVKKGEEKQFKYAIDYYAKPQNGIFISANSNEDLIQLIDEKANEMIQSFHKTEIKEKQRRMSLSLFDSKPVKDSLGVSFIAPSVYRIGKLTNNFAWLRKDIRSGDLNLLIYEMPLNYFQNDSTRIKDIIKMRDSIGKTHIPGPVDNSYMITEKAYSPYLFESEVNGKFAYQTKGTWEVYNFFMAGPFVNYIIRDEQNNRNLVVEGFTFAPSIDKRDYQFELEAIIQSFKFE
ncbi:MAG: DUF4837 family protein [Flavobacteriaceae bacterium]|nr:DUF4837 family protein [Flavobacteriaceae bacterium]